MGFLKKIGIAITFAEKLQQADLVKDLTEARQEWNELLQDNIRLQEENRRLRDAAKQREGMAFRDNVWWRGSGDEAAGPFCPKCKGSDKVNPMAAHEEDDFWRCAVCGCAVRRPGTSSGPALRFEREPLWDEKF